MTVTTNREKMLLLLLPAMVIAGGYSLKLSGISARLTAATAALAAAEKSVPAPAAVQAQQQRLAELNQRLAEIELQTSEWERIWGEMRASRAGNSHARIETIEGLTEVLNRNDLELQEGGPAETSESARLPKELEELVKLLAEKQASTQPQLWRVRFIGRYGDVMDALEELQTEEPLAIPVHLQMTNASLTTDLRTWTLYLWI